MTVAVYGIDPGVRGAIARIRLDQTTRRPFFVRCERFPTKRSTVSPRTKNAKARARYRLDVLALADLFRSMHVTGLPRPVVFIESAIAMPKQSSTSTMQQGINLGIVIGLAWALLEPERVELVHPTVWKKLMEVTAEKETCIGKARQLVGHLRPDPDAPMTDGEAEAICIALAGAHIMQEQAE